MHCTHASACNRHAGLCANNMLQAHICLAAGTRARPCSQQARVPAENHALQACPCLQRARVPAEKNALQARPCLQRARVLACK
eukprot:5498363-Karenia_brevis.AAC.1